MARLSVANPTASLPDPTLTNLTRILARLQHSLNSPDPDAESKLRRSSVERDRIGNNLDYAKSLLLKLEKEALGIKVQSQKVETQTDLVRKREVILRLSERLDELNEFADPSEDESDGEDLLGEDTPSETTEEHTTPLEQASPILSPPSLPHEASLPHPQPLSPLYPSQEPPSSLRSRQPQSMREELFTSHTTGTHTSGTTPPASISTTTETLLTHNRTEQEALTTSLLAMATALKESSKSFSTSLEAEKSTLDRTVEGLDKNELGLEAASRRMGHLRSLTEGKGWLGRMLLYAYIAGLAVFAILLVFVFPKLRF